MKVKSSFGASYTEYEVGDIVMLAKDRPLKLLCGVSIENFPLAYQTYGKLNKDKSNAILICHALTGDQYVASKNPVTNKEGWWSSMVGPNKAIDTNKFFVICSNVIGGCMGSFGPKSVDVKTNKPYGISFPFITIHDMVNAQNLLIQELGIDKLHAVIGGSAGGMQVLSWALLYPHKINIAIPIATSYRHSPQNIAFHEVGRQAIMADSNYCSGDYIAQKKFPSKGLAVARMTAHITYLSEKSLQEKFGRNLQDKESLSFHFQPDFQVESYLHHQGYSFVERFDPNSYLYITKAVDYFDLEADGGSRLANVFSKFELNRNLKFYVISFADDWLFPVSESRKLVSTLNLCNINVSSIEIESGAGHDSFLIGNNVVQNTIIGAISSL